MSDQVVVPISLTKSVDSADTVDFLLPTSGVVVEMEVVTHAVDAAYSSSFHKAQSKTVQLVVPDLCKHSFPPALSLFALLVGMSRVNSSAGMRLLPPMEGDPKSGPAALDHLADLRHSDSLIAFMASFDRDGVFSVDMAKAVLQGMLKRAEACRAVSARRGGKKSKAAAAAPAPAASGAAAAAGAAGGDGAQRPPAPPGGGTARGRPPAPPGGGTARGRPATGASTTAAATPRPAASRAGATPRPAASRAGATICRPAGNLKPDDGAAPAASTAAAAPAASAPVQPSPGGMVDLSGDYDDGSAATPGSAQRTAPAPSPGQQAQPRRLPDLVDVSDDDPDSVSAAAPAVHAIMPDVRGRLRPPHADVAICYVGIPNPANSCYLNSTVQGLLRVPVLQDLFDNAADLLEVARQGRVAAGTADNFSGCDTADGAVLLKVVELRQALTARSQLKAFTAVWELTQLPAMKAAKFCVFRQKEASALFITLMGSFHDSLVLDEEALRPAALRNRGVFDRSLLSLDPALSEDDINARTAEACGAWRGRFGSPILDQCGVLAVRTLVCPPDDLLRALLDDIIEGHRCHPPSTAECKVGRLAFIADWTYGLEHERLVKSGHVGACTDAAFQTHKPMLPLLQSVTKGVQTVVECSVCEQADVAPFAGHTHVYHPFIRRDSLLTAPPFLALTINRALPVRGPDNKDATGWVLPSEVDGHALFPELLRTGQRTYDLVAVQLHWGHSTLGGHYTCIARHAGSGRWFHYDDGEVTDVDGARVSHNRRGGLEWGTPVMWFLAARP